jgi:hypothetical protein
MLGGSVSAGHTASVLDFPIEALDTWTTAEGRDDPRLPTHNPAIRVIAGT